jgi:DNA polymerase III epsilon subunit-like protein
MERKLVPYLSIDIETTGISDKAQILQISAIFDDLKSNVDSLRKIDLPIKHQVLNNAEPYAIGMNADLFKKMMDKNFKTYSSEEAAKELVTFIKGCKEALPMDWTGKVQQKLVFAGKNVASFDIPKIKAFLESIPKDYIKSFNEDVHYKTLDVGSLYFDTFGENVSLSEINKLTGRNQVSHNALDDAFDVVYAVRHKLGVK